jgi:hypothetical protein
MSNAAVDSVQKGAGISQAAAEAAIQENADMKVELTSLRELVRHQTAGRKASAVSRWILRAAPSLGRDISGIAGGVLISYGAGRIYAAAGFIVGGILLLAGALLAARSKE